MDSISGVFVISVLAVAGVAAIFQLNRGQIPQVGGSVVNTTINGLFKSN